MAARRHTEPAEFRQHPGATRERMGLQFQHQNASALSQHRTVAIPREREAALRRKLSIIVPNKDQLVATLDTVIAGVKAGELDEHLAQQAKARGVPKPKQIA